MPGFHLRGCISHQTAWFQFQLPYWDSAFLLTIPREAAGAGSSDRPQTELPAPARPGSSPSLSLREARGLGRGDLFPESNRVRLADIFQFKTLSFRTKWN